MAEDAARTREHLINVAERLFAQQGIDGVSLRAIGVAAGQRNNSAAQYHFGSKQGLLDAIVAARSAVIEARRKEMLEDFRSSGRELDLASVASLSVRPLAESLAAPRPGDATPSYYLRFLDSALRTPSVRASWREAAISGTARELGRTVRTLLPELSRADLGRRLEWAAMVSIQVLAEREREQQAAGPLGPSVIDRTVRELVAMQVALMTCP